MHRTQILFPRWLNEYVDFAAKRCGISKGEMIRVTSCIGIVLAFKKRGVKIEKFDELMSTFEKIQKNYKDPDAEKIAEFHDMLFFETRKLIEERLKEVEKEKCPAA
jgi:hypothetical protein